MVRSFIFVGDAKKSGVSIYHAGTTYLDEDMFWMDGGRVLTIVGEGATAKDARVHAYEAVAHLSGTLNMAGVPAWRCRIDIALYAR